MGLISRLFSETGPHLPVTEATDAGGNTSSPDERKGYEYGISVYGQEVASTMQNERRIEMEQMFQAYLACTWSSACVDVISRSITAGGLEVFLRKQPDMGEIPDDPPNVLELRALIEYCNEHEDMIQLLRRCITDLLIFGDAYIEVVWAMGRPVALYVLDPVTMTINSDPHGNIEEYVQNLDGQHVAHFEPHEVVHISMDSPRGGLYGVSPTQKALLPITAWLFTEALIKECFRRGDPPVVHVDHTAGTKDTDLTRFLNKYLTQNIGPKNIGTPMITVGGAVVKELSQRKVTDYIAASKQLRDEIVSTYGMLPGKVGIIESGNIGSGTGEAQDKTYRINTTIPIANLVLEKLNFHLVKRGFEIIDYEVRFKEIDMRDSEVVERIRDMRVRNGTYVLNRARDEIGEPPVPGGDEAVLVDRQNLVLWDDMAAYSAAGILGRGKSNVDPDALDIKHGIKDGVDTIAPPEPPPPVAMNPDGTPAPPGSSQGSNPDGPGGPKDLPQGKGPRESGPEEVEESLRAAHASAFRHRRRRLLKEKVDA